MLNKQTEIAAAIGSRICHDLISPIGAISNGLELLELSGVSQSPELALIAESVKNANARVRFLRIAFGDASLNDGIGHSEVHDILTNFYSDGRINLSWNIQGAISRKNLKMCFLTLLCVEKTIPYGGFLSISESENRWHITTKGKDLKVKPYWDMQRMRLHPQDGPSLIQFELAQNIVDELGCHYQFIHSDDQFNLTITPLSLNLF